MIDLSDYSASLEMKMNPIDTISLLNVNHKLVSIKVVFTNINPINKQLMMAMVDKYEYLYRFKIEYSLHAVDINFHRSIK